jgi:hypothetical protein
VLEPERARLVLLAQNGIEDVRVSDDELRFTGDEQAVAALSVSLGKAGIGVTALVPETQSLEELFLGMTDGESSDHDRGASSSEVAV